MRTLHLLILNMSPHNTHRKLRELCAATNTKSKTRGLEQIVIL